MKSKKPFFSIVIPTLNEEYYLPRLLKDLNKQKKMFLFEVLVVDAYSEDKTQEVARKNRGDLDLTIIKSKRRNLSYQRNLGGKKAKGQYIIFIDADCCIPKDFLLRTKSIIEKDKSLIISPCLMATKNSSLDNIIIEINNYIIPFFQHIGRPLTFGACLIFEKNFFIHIGMFAVTSKQDKNKLFPEDIEFMILAFKAGVLVNYPKDIKFNFSFRRFKREGHLVVLSKYVIGVMEMLLKGNADSLSVSYPMGGQYYVKKRSISKSEIKKQLKSFKNQVAIFFSGIVKRTD